MKKPNDFLYPLLRFVIGCWLLSYAMSACIPLHLPPSTPTPTGSTTPTATKISLPTLTPSPTSTIQLSEEQIYGISIRFWHPFSGEIATTFDQLAKEFSLQNPWHLSVVGEAINGVDLLNEHMKGALEQGELPHLVIAPLYQALRWNQIRPVLVDWSIYSEDVMWGESISDQQGYYPNLWQASVVDGYRWGIPARRVAQVFLYNASWANELGFRAAPKTFAEFQQQACAIRSEDNQGDPNSPKGYLFTHDYPTILGWLLAFGAQITPNASEGYQFKTGEVQEALTFLRKLYEAGCTQNVPDLDPIEAFSQRKALVVPINSAQLEEVERAMKYAANPDRWTVLPFPTGNGEGLTVLYGTDYVLLRSSEREQLAAWLFVRWLLEKETQQRLAQKTLGLPLRRDVGEDLQNETRVLPAYRAALEYLPLGLNEPLWASWDKVRWAVGDASRQLVAWYFTLDQMPALVQLLDKTAADLSSQQP